MNISGFHVDPGFKGRLKFSLYNAGNRLIALEYDAPTFLIWYADMDAETVKPYKGTHNGQNRISTEDREVMSEESHSPAALAARLSALERAFSFARAIGGTIAVGIILPVIASAVWFFMQDWLESRKPKDSSSPQKDGVGASALGAPAPVTTPPPAP